MEKDSVEAMVLGEISNDFEEFGQILMDVTRFGAEENVRIEREDVEVALRKLVDGGLAKAYSVDTLRSQLVKVAVDWAEVDISGLWFYISDAGKAVLRELE